MKKANVFLFGSVILILLAVALVAIIDRSSSNGGSEDVRARAGVAFTLKLVGIVDAVDETAGTVQVSSVQFADSNRAGEVKNLGTWVVTPPDGFDFGSLSPGSSVTIGVDAKTFQVSSHKMNAITLVGAPAR